MQGTFVRLSQALRPAITKPPVSAEPAQTAAAQTPIAPVPVSAKAASTVAAAHPKEQSSSSTWIWISVGLAVILCIAVIAVVRNSRLIAARRVQNNSPAATVTLFPTVNVPPPAATNPAANTPPPTQLAPSGGGADTNLNLALSAWQNHDLKTSMDELQKAVSLRPDQNDFLTEAATQLYDAGQYIGAAYVYAHIEQNQKGTQQPLPPEIRDRLEPSFYFAAAMDDFPLYIPFDLLRNNDPPLALFAQSRYALFHGNMDAAHHNLDELLRMQPGWPMAQLLDAEILLHDGKKLEARKVLQGLIASPRAQDWVKEQAGILLNKSQ
jgi:hypothetical protein